MEDRPGGGAAHLPMLTPTTARSLSLRASEWICLAYLAWITVLSFFVNAPLPRRWQLAILNAAIALGIFSLPFSPAVLRDWIPVPLILIGYHEAGRLTFPRGDHFFEDAFLRWDRILFSKALSWNTPGWFDASLEFFYLQCYSIVPLGMALLDFTGERRFADYYWTIVLGSAFAAYALTPLFPALPPRTVGVGLAPAPKRSDLRRFSSWISDHWSIKVDSFPSGHGAAAMAATLAMLRVLPFAGFCYLIVTIGILIGSVRGRYHYAVDAAAGALLAISVYFIVPMP